MRFLIVVVFCAASTVASVASAEPVRMGLADAMRRAAQAAPALGPRRAALSSSRDVVTSADRVFATPPRLEVEIGPRFRTNEGTTGFDATLGVWQDLPLGGLGNARKAWATALTDEAGARLRVTLHDVRAQAALAWVDARLAQELGRIRRASLVNAEAIVKLANARARAGSVSPAEEATARTVAGRARADVVDAEGRRFVAETELRHLTGVRAGELRVVGPLDVEGKPVALADARTRRAQPDALALDAAARRSERTTELIHAGGKPSLALGPSVTREATGDWIVLARLAVPLPFTNPASFDTARARSDAIVLRAEARRLRAELERELDLASEERNHARELRDILRKDVISPAKEALRQALLQYEAGSIDTAAVLTAQRELLSAEERWAEACADVRRADIRLMRFSGSDSDVQKGPTR